MNTSSIAMQKLDGLFDTSPFFFFWMAAVLELSGEGFTNAMKRIRNHSGWQSLLIQEDTHTHTEKIRRGSDEAPFQCT